MSVELTRTLRRTKPLSFLTAHSYKPFTFSLRFFFAPTACSDDSYDVPPIGKVQRQIAAANFACTALTILYRFGAHPLESALFASANRPYLSEPTHA